MSIRAQLEPISDRRLSSGFEVTAIGPSPSGRIAIVAAGQFNDAPEIAVWDVRTLQPIRPLPAHGVIRSVAWSPDEKVVATAPGTLWFGGQGVKGDSIFLWDPETGAELSRFGGEFFGLHGLAFSPDGRLLATAGRHGPTEQDGNSCDVWEVASGKHMARLAEYRGRVDDISASFSSVAFSPDGALVIAGCSQKHYQTGPDVTMKRPSISETRWVYRGIRMWRLSDGCEMDRIRYEGSVKTLSVCGDGAAVFAAGEALAVWNLKDGRARWQKSGGFTDVTNPSGQPAAMSRDGRFMARGIGYKEDHGPYVDTAVELCGANTGEPLAKADHHAVVTALAFTDDGVSIIAGGELGEVRHWRCVLS